MPYSNVPEHLWDKMDRCVKDVMANPKFKPLSGKTPKQSAIAICYKQIMGGKKIDMIVSISLTPEDTKEIITKSLAEEIMKRIEISQGKEVKKENMANEELEKAKWTRAFINDLPDSAFAYIEPGGTKDKEGKTVPRSKRHLPYKDASGKIDEAHLRNALARLPQTNISAEAKAKAKSKLVVAAKKVGIEVTEKIDLVGKEVKEMKKVEKKLDKEETKATEKKTEKIEKVEAVKEEEKAEPEKVEKKVEVKKEEEKEEEKEEKVEPKIDSETLLQKLTGAIDDLTKKVDSLSELVKAPAEKVAKVEKAPKVEAGKAPKEEVKKVEKVEETKEKVEKKEDTSSGEASAELLKELEEIKERLEKVEKSPAKAKVVVSKGFGGEVEKEEGRLEKIDKRLEELYKIRKDKPQEYGESHMEEAFKLLDEKERLLRG